MKLRDRLGRTRGITPMEKMVVATGTYRAGIPGGLLAFALWNIPSFIVLTLAGLGVKDLLKEEDPDWLAGVAPAAVALVFIAAYKVWVQAGVQTSRQV